MKRERIRLGRVGRSLPAPDLRSHFALARRLPCQSPHGGDAGAIHLPSRPEEAWLAWPCRSFAMRTRISIVVIAILSGCAGTRDSQRTGQGTAGSQQATPVVMKQPTPSERLKYRHQREAEQEGMAMTEVQDAIKR